MTKKRNGQGRSTLRLLRLAATAALVGVALLGARSAGAEGPNAVITNPGCVGTNLPANDDGSSARVDLPFPINFFGTSYNSLFVNNNGNVTFDSALSTFTPFGLSGAQRVIIAPFFADVDTRGGVSDLVHYGAISAGSTDVNGHAAFCVNWVNVGYYSGHTDKLNSFQLVLIDRSDTGEGNFDIEFNYDKVQWETGDASSGRNGLGGNPVRIGYSNGHDASFELPGSGVSGAFLDSNANTGLVHNNVNALFQPGRYVFPVRNGAAIGHALSGTVRDSEQNVVGGALVQACPTPADTPCRNATANGAGFYIFNNLPDHTSGGGAVDHQWNLTINPPGGSSLLTATLGPVTIAGSDVVDQNVTLREPREVGDGTEVSTPTGGTDDSGTPTVFNDDPITLSVQGCTGGSGEATLSLPDGYSQHITLTEGPAGTYTGTFDAPAPHHGVASVSYTVCGGQGAVDVYVQASGQVLATDGDPVTGATVTLLSADDPAGPFTAVPDGSAIMSPGNRHNPDQTDSQGQFGWDVLAGYYKIRAVKDGCTPSEGAETPVLTVPPQPSGIVLRLDCGTQTSTTTTDTGTTTTTAPPPPPPPPPKSDASLSVSGPASVRTGNDATFTATIRNGGPNSATGVELHAPVPAGSTFVSASLSNGNPCRENGGTVTCFVATVDAGTSATATIVLKADTAGPLTLAASMQADYDVNGGDNSSSATTTVLAQDALPLPPPPSSQPGEFNAVGTGTVTINGTPLPADKIVVLDSGDSVDVTGGSLTFTTSDGDHATFSGVPPTSARQTSARSHARAASDVPAEFKVNQDATTGSVTELELVGGDFSVCNTNRSLSAKQKQTRIRSLWGSAKGKFRTKARYSSATVRGTIWLTEDRCDGSFTQVVESVVDVQDFVRNKTVTLTAGQSYLAQPKVAKKPAKKHAKKQAKRHVKKHAQPKQVRYVVRNGDSLSTIATQRLGNERRWADIAKLNSLDAPYTVQPGDTIKLPRR